jgi:hypothetical protein
MIVKPEKGSDHQRHSRQKGSPEKGETVPRKCQRRSNQQKMLSQNAIDLVS